MTPARKKATALLLAATLAAGCSGGLHPYHPNLYSVDGEIRLGKQLSRQVEQEMHVLHHTTLTRTVDEIGERLLAAAGPAFRRFPYSFKVVDSPEVNAFALPGGPIYVNMGLVEMVDSEDELAAVIAHEMSHVAARHATEMLTTQNLTNLALLVAISVIPVAIPPIALEGTRLAYVLGLLHYSRGKESEADRLGLQLMTAAGYDPAAMGTLFEKLAAQRRSMPSLVERMFSSHPLSEDRLREVRRYVAAHPHPATSTQKAASSPFAMVKEMFARD